MFIILGLKPHIAPFITSGLRAGAKSVISRQQAVGKQQASQSPWSEDDKACSGPEALAAAKSKQLQRNSHPQKELSISQNPPPLFPYDMSICTVYLLVGTVIHSKIWLRPVFSLFRLYTLQLYFLPLIHILLLTGAFAFTRGDI